MTKVIRITAQPRDTRRTDRATLETPARIPSGVRWSTLNVLS